MEKLKKATQPKLWVQDILRHTSISFQHKRDKNEPLTAFNNGTSTTIIKQHYLTIVEEDGHVEEFWRISPDFIQAEDIQVQLYKSPPINVDWSSKAQLRKMVKATPVIRIARELGVSDNAVRKHCNKLEIELPKRGYWQKVKHGNPRKKK